MIRKLQGLCGIFDTIDRGNISEAKNNSREQKQLDQSQNLKVENGVITFQGNVSSSRRENQDSKFENMKGCGFRAAANCWLIICFLLKYASELVLHLIYQG